MTNDRQVGRFAYYLPVQDDELLADSWAEHLLESIEPSRPEGARDRLAQAIESLSVRIGASLISLAECVRGR